MDERIQRRRRDVWLLRLVALIITLLLWTTVLGGRKVEVSKRIQLEFQLPKDLVAANNLPTEATFTIVGPRAFLNEFSQRTQTLRVDLTKFTRGEHSILLREEMLELPLGLKVMGIAPQIVPFKLDRVLRKRVPVQVVLNKQLPPELAVKSFSVQPSTVELEGAASQLALISQVSTESVLVSLESYRDTQTVNLSLGEVPSVRILGGESSVRVSVDIDGTLSRRWVNKIPVQLKVGTGPRQRPSDFKQPGIRLVPNEVRLFLEGSKDVLSGLKNEQIEVWVELPELKRGEFEAKVVWSLVPGVRVVRRSHDSVRVVVP